MRNFLLILALIVLVLTACNNTATETQSSDASVAPTDTAPESEAVEPMATDKEDSEAAPKPTDTNEPEPTDEPISSTNMEEVEQTYKTLVMIQVVTESLHETALQVQNGELDGFESLGAIIAVGAMAKGIEEVIPEIDHPDYLASELRAAESLNNEARSILIRWMDQEIDAVEVMTELEPLLEEIDTTVTDAEEKLAREAGLNSDNLTQSRQEVLEAVAEVFEEATPVPTPEPEETSEPPEGEKIALNYLGEQDSGGVTVEIGRVLVGDKELLKYDTSNTFSDDIFSGKDVVGEIIFVITNNSDETVNLYPVMQGSAQVNNEQIDFSDYMFADVLLGEDMDGEIFPGVQKVGGLWFGIKRSSLEEVDSMIFRIDAPASTENYQKLGEDYEITVDLSNRIFEPFPEELH